MSDETTSTRSLPDSFNVLVESPLCKRVEQALYLRENPRLHLNRYDPIITLRRSRASNFEVAQCAATVACGLRGAMSCGCSIQTTDDSRGSTKRFATGTSRGSTRATPTRGGTCGSTPSSNVKMHGRLALSLGRRSARSHRRRLHGRHCPGVEPQGTYDGLDRYQGPHRLCL